MGPKFDVKRLGQVRSKSSCLPMLDVFLNSGILITSKAWHNMLLQMEDKVLCMELHLLIKIRRLGWETKRWKDRVCEVHVLLLGLFEKVSNITIKGLTWWMSPVLVMLMRGTESNQTMKGSTHFSGGSNCYEELGKNCSQLICRPICWKTFLSETRRVIWRDYKLAWANEESLQSDEQMSSNLGLEHQPNDVSSSKKISFSLFLV